MESLTCLVRVWDGEWLHNMGTKVHPVEAVVRWDEKLSKMGQRYVPVYGLLPLNIRGMLAWGNGEPLILECYRQSAKSFRLRGYEVMSLHRPFLNIYMHNMQSKGNTPENPLNSNLA